MRKQAANIKNNEQGLVAIVVTMVIMIVLTLIVLGFTQLARREQREALDRQLASQAFYAAESGINDARRLLKTPAYESGDLEKTDCASTNSSLDGDTSQYPCLLIKQKLPDAKFQNVQTNKSTVVPINPEPLPGQVATNKLTISWENRDGDTGINSDPGLPPAGTWGKKIGMLRIDLIPADTLSASAMRDGTFTAFLRPKATPTGSEYVVPYTATLSDQGQIINANCATGNGAKKKCYATITNLTGLRYYIRMKAIYNVADVVVCPDDQDCGGEVILKGTQAEIDVTGRANDVLKRVQVRVSKEPQFDGSSVIPEYALDSAESVCKLFSVWPGDGSEAACTP